MLFKQRQIFKYVLGIVIVEYMLGLLLVLFLAGAMGCASMPTIPSTTTQHPAFAINSGQMAVLGTAVASILSSNPYSAVVGGIAGMAFGNMESSLVAGPPAQTTTVTTTQTAATTQTAKP